MSIADEIATLCNQGRLTALASRAPRSLYVNAEVRQMIEPPYVGDEGIQFVQARGILENFAQNGRISVRWDPLNRASAILARNDPVIKRVFDFRSRDPLGGVRVFGKFAEKDCFVALTYQFRDDLEGDAWTKEIDRCCKEWTTLFGATPCLEKDSPNDYLTANFIVARPRRERARS